MSKDDRDMPHPTDPRPLPEPVTALRDVRSWRDRVDGRLTALDAQAEAHGRSLTALGDQVALLAQRTGWWAALGAAVPALVSLLVELLGG